MKYFILFTIRIYWKLIPASQRRNCLFSQSCSNYVYQQALKYGFWAGVKSFKLRFNQCRPGYRLGYDKNNHIVVYLADGSISPENEFSDYLLNTSEYKRLATRQ